MNKIIIAILLSPIWCSCLKPNDSYILDDKENVWDSIDTSKLPVNNITIQELENPKSKSEGLDYVCRIECPEPSENSENNLLIIKTDSTYGVNYALEWDCEKKAQRWSAMQMYHGNSLAKVRRSGDDAWHPDGDIPEEFRTDYEDHYQNGYDRGHMIASADRLESRSMNKQTFCYSNVHPQLNELNAGIWEQMEEQVRAWNTDDFRDTLYVVKGGTIDNEEQILGLTTSGLIIPKYFFMAILCLKDGEYKALAFWIEHKKKYYKSEYDLQKYVVSISQLETFTGINFFYNLAPEIQDEVENDVNIEDWDL